jgi:serine/threonine protein phosphatase 1
MASARAEGLTGRLSRWRKQAIRSGRLFPTQTPTGVTLELFRRLFRGPTEKVSNPRLPDGMRVYAIGDVHGRADLLIRMLELVVLHLERARPAASALCVLLGDYIDRGPESRSVLDVLTAAVLPMRMVALRGNHETMLLNFLSDPHTGANWRYSGGLETLHSYGLDVSEFREGGQFENIAELFRAEMPATHFDFIQQTQLCFSVGDYFFCHAGVRPRIPLEQQREEDLLWIREEFLSSNLNHGKIVVHGHTPVLEPDVKHNRINIDTGAYITSRLTALILEGERREFLST